MEVGVGLLGQEGALGNEDAEVRQAVRKAIRAIEELDAVDVEDIAEIDLPPGLRSAVGVGHGAVVVFAVAIPVDRPRRNAAPAGRDLFGRSVHRDVRAAGVDLNLGEREIVALDELDPQVAADDAGDDLVGQPEGQVGGDREIALRIADGIDAQSAVDHVGPGAADKTVVVPVAEELVVALAADQGVVAGPAFEHVVALAAVQGVVVRVAEQMVVAQAAVDAFDPDQGFGRGSGRGGPGREVDGPKRGRVAEVDEIEARAAVEAVEAVVAGEDIVAGAAEELVVTGAAMEPVVAVAAEQGVVAGDAVDDVVARAAVDGVAVERSLDDVVAVGDGLRQVGLRHVRHRPDGAVLELDLLETDAGDPAELDRRGGSDDHQKPALLEAGRPRNADVGREDRGPEHEAIDALAARVADPVDTVTEAEVIAVGSLGAVERVVARTAGDHVVAAEPEDRVVQVGSERG